MEKFVINGGNRLYGTVDINGAKNAAVAIIPAAIMSSGIVTLENVPDIADVNSYIKILQHLGCKVEFKDNTLTIDPRGLDKLVASTEEVRSMRGSYYLIGALLGRYGKATVDMQGGCQIGDRPIDQHTKGFESLGATVESDEVSTTATAESLKGAHIYFDVVTVGATMNVMLAAVFAKGTTTLENAAREPHVVDLANFLNTMGADIKGAGTDVIRIKGVEELKGCTYSVIPDQIEASTYMLAAAACGGEVKINNVIPKHLESISSKLVEMGADIEEKDDYLIVRNDKRLKAIHIKTLPYPGFPTDVQQPMTTLMCIADGRSTVYESIYENRFMHLAELNKMGALAVSENRTAGIEGVPHLTGTKVRATDLRAGAALIIAGLVAIGTTEITDIEHIDRGYPHIEEKLRALGADIERVVY
ncbi:MAG: UDP-N-acetylglucosamine 1-carboxyvinyltransferase [Clostridiaceae bacterium]